MRETAHPPVLYYGWFIVAVTFFISFVTVGARNGFGVFVIPMEKEFGWDRSTIAVAFIVATLVGGVSQPFLGRLYGKLGARRVTLAGLITIGVFTILLSLTFHIVFLVLIYGVVIAIGMSGTSLTTAGALLSRWFRRKRATVIGLSTAGASLGGLILVPFAAYLLDLTSWRLTWVALGAIVLVLAVPVAFFLLRDDPGELGLQPDGDRDPADTGGVPRALTPEGPLEVSRWRDSFKSPPMWQLSGAYFVCGYTTNIISMHFVPFAEGEGFSRSTAATAFGLMSGLNAVGVITFAMLSDRLGRKNLLASVYALRGVGYGVLLLAPGGWGLWGFKCIAGFSWIATVPLTASLTADIYGLRTLGTLGGISFLAHQVGGSISVLLAAVIYDATGSYVIPFASCAILLLAASVTAFSIREKRYSTKYQAGRSLRASTAGM